MKPVPRRSRGVSPYGRKAFVASEDKGEPYLSIKTQTTSNNCGDRTSKIVDPEKNSNSYGIIQLSEYNTIQGTLEGGKTLHIVVDSGASSTFLSEHAIQSSSYLRSLPQEKCNPEKIRIADGSYIECDRCILFKVNVQGFDMHLKAQIMPSVGLVGCLLGASELKTLSANLDFSTNVLQFKLDPVPFKTTTEVQLEPGQKKVLNLLGKMPKNAKSGEIVLHATTLGKKLTSEYLLLLMNNERCPVMIHNDSKKRIRIKRGSVLAHIDVDATSNPCLETFSCFSAQSDTDRDKLAHEKYKKYPFLDRDDHRLRMTDEEVLDEQVDLLTDCVLSHDERHEFRQILRNNKQAFSLHDEIGDCEYEVKLDLIDDTPFFIRPFTVTETDKVVIDKELSKLVKMGVLKQGVASSSSPVMLLNKKGPGNRKRLVSDLRFLNTKIRKQNWPFPLVVDSVQKIGMSGCSVISTVDLKDAFHSLRLHPDSQCHTGIMSYFGGKSYYYTRLPQGASVSPSTFQMYIEQVLDSIPGSRNYCIAHMDDLIVFSKDNTEHMVQLNSLLEGIKAHGLKISPSKAKFFRCKVQYMGHIISIRDGRPHLEVVKDKCEAIRRLRAPINAKEVRRFIGAVNYLSRFLPGLQELLLPINKLSRKSKDFKWSEECQTNFEKIRQLLAEPPILTMPSSHGELILYSDTSRHATGAALCQVIDGRERLLAYHSKTLPSAARSYSVSELELLGLVINATAFKNILKGAQVTFVVDHSALVHMAESKKELATARAKKLFDKLSDMYYSFAYMKGEDMVISDLLSRMCDPEDDPVDQILPIALVGTRSSERRTTRSYAKSHPVVHKELPPVTRKKKSNPSRSSPQNSSSEPISFHEQPVNIPQGQPPCVPVPVVPSVPSIPIPVPTPPISGDSESIPVVHRPVPHRPVVDRPITRQTTRNIQGDDYDPPFDEDDDNDLQRRPVLQRQVVEHMKPQNRTLIGAQWNKFHGQDRVEVPVSTLIPRRDLSNPVQEISSIHNPMNEVLLQSNQPLFHGISRNQVVSGHIPRQKDIMKNLELIKQKCLRDFTIPLKAAEIKREYLNSVFFSDIYKYLTQGLQPSKRKKALSVISSAEQYILVQGVLFRIHLGHASDDLRLALCIPESQCEYIISMYHDSLLGCHQGINRTFQTIRTKFFIPGLYEKLASYIRSCEICQQRKIPQARDKEQTYQPRIFTEYCPFQEIHVDIKHLFPALDGSKYLLVATCVQTRYVVAYPLKAMDAVSCAEALLQRVVFQFGPPKRLVSDQGKSFANQILSYILKTLRIESLYVSPENHGSLVVERSIRTVSGLLLSQLEGHGRNWPVFVQACCYAYNSFSHTLLDGYSPFELVYGRPPPDHLNIRMLPTDDIPSTYHMYVVRLKQRFEAIGATVLRLHNQNQIWQSAKHEQTLRKKHVYRVGDLVYFLMPTAANLQTNTRKFVVSYIGPVRVKAVLDDTHVVLEDMSGRELAGVHHVHRLKPANIRSISGNIQNNEQLLQNLQKSGDVSTAHVILGNGYFEPEQDSFTYYVPPVQIIDTDITLDERCYLADTSHGLSDSYNDVAHSCLPEADTVLNLTKSRLKNGDLQVLFSDSENSFCSWYTLKYFPRLYNEVVQLRIPFVSGSLNKLGKSLMGV